MSMITRIGFENRTKGFFRSVNDQLFRQPKEWSRLQRLGDAVWNIIDGYKPVVVKGIDKTTGKKIALKDEKGRKFINWVRDIKKDNYVVTDTLNFNGTKIVTARDINNGQVVAKEVSKSYYQGMDFIKSSFENGKVKAVEKRQNGPFDSSLTYWVGRNPDGKLNKTVFENIADYPNNQKARNFCAENCPEFSRGV